MKTKNIIVIYRLLALGKWIYHLGTVEIGYFITGLRLYTVLLVHIHQTSKHCNCTVAGLHLEK